MDEKVNTKYSFCMDVLDGSPPCSVFSLAGERDEGWNVEKKFREGQKVQYVCGMSVPSVMMANLSREVYRQWLT